MRPMVLFIVLVAAFAVSGCGVPAAVQGDIVTASQLLHRNVTDARAEKIGIWEKLPPGATQDEIIAQADVQKKALLQVMDQAGKNLKSADDFFKVNRNTDPDSIKEAD